MRLEISIKQVNKFTPQIRKVIDNGFEFDSAFELTKFMRGTLFIYVDFLLSYDYKGND